MTGGEDNNARFSTIESNVVALKTEVTGIKGEVSSINDKLDKLIDNFDKLSAETNRVKLNNEKHVTQATHDGFTGSGATSSGLQQLGMQAALPASHVSTLQMGGTQHPGNGRREQIPRGQSYGARYMHNGNMGHISEIYGSHSIAKPYMYVEREGVSTQKQKLDIRHQITALEYVDATLALLADKKAYDSRDLENIMCHLKNATRDALECPWATVRRWSQYVWDCIEKGTIKWADRDTIQQERVTICLTGGGVVLNQTVPNAHRRGQQGVIEVVCRSYNTRQGCSYRDSHHDGPVFALHICSYCDHIGRACAHSIKECERKITHARGYQDNGGQGSQQGGYQGNTYQGYNRQNNLNQGYNRHYNQNQGNFNGQYMAKNGAMAPHQ